MKQFGLGFRSLIFKCHSCDHEWQSVKTEPQTCDWCGKFGEMIGWVDNKASGNTGD